MEATPEPADPAGPCPIDHRSPWLVAILGVLTLGVYFAYWIWETSKEAHAFDEYGASPYDVTKWAVPTAVGAAIGALLAGGAFLTMMTSRMPAQPTPGSMPATGPAFWIVWGVLAVANFTLLAAAVGLLVADWRLWKFVERHERGIGRSSTLSPGLLLGAFLVSYFLVLPLPLAAGYVLHRTQTGLNRIRAAALDGYEAEQAWGPDGRPPARDQAQDEGPGGSAAPPSPGPRE